MINNILFNLSIDPYYVTIAIRKVVPQKSGARTIDCAMNYCVIVRSIIFISFCNGRFTSH